MLRAAIEQIYVICYKLTYLQITLLDIVQIFMVGNCRDKINKNEIFNTNKENFIIIKPIFRSKMFKTVRLCHYSTEPWYINIVLLPRDTIFVLRNEINFSK